MGTPVVAYTMTELNYTVTPSCTFTNVVAEIIAYPVFTGNVENFYDSFFSVQYTINYTQTDPSGETINLATQITTDGAEETTNTQFTMGNAVLFPFTYPEVGTVTFTTGIQSYTTVLPGGPDLRTPFGFGLTAHILKNDTTQLNIANNGSQSYSMLNQWYQNIIITGNPENLQILTPVAKTVPARMKITPNYIYNSDGRRFNIQYAFALMNLATSPPVTKQIDQISISYTFNGVPVNDSPTISAGQVPDINAGGVSDVILAGPVFLEGPSGEWTLSDITYKIEYQDV
jgi:hypothetical protein